MGGGDSVLVYPDLPGLLAAPAAPTPVRIPLAGRRAVAAAFSPDASRLYVLSTSDALRADGDPCTAPGSAVLESRGLDGSTLRTWTLSTAAADLLVDPRGAGDLLIAQPALDQVAALPPETPDGAVTPRRLFDGRCASALELVGNDLFIVTNELAPMAPVRSFILRRVPLTGGPPKDLVFPAPVYRTKVNETDPPSGRTRFTLEVQAQSLVGYDIAVSPDASYVVFATRARHVEARQRFELIEGFQCEANLSIVEYGRYFVDTRSAGATYESRSQAVLTPIDGRNCIQCDNGFFLVDFDCPARAGDRPAGLAAVFAN
jgi:hypothetical protein